FGIHCVGCGASGFETLEEGVLGHGFSEEELDILVNNLNKAIDSKSKTKTNNTNKETFSLILTEKAVKKLKEIMKQENKENGYLRAAVLAGGCSGYTYDLELTEEKFAEDIQLEQNGVKILISEENIEYLNGTKIDFIDTLKESGFKFLNPNATKECGCGKSFS
ncbi:MAG TPA: iron-sulfur cluster assembly accessory protein, partial [Candidatus Nanoarchaeia archaeon]|nr:iron-sulfur cluster assembly accessory protein [Candidatus Nanoarchaeia archaeon]